MLIALLILNVLLLAGMILLLLKWNNREPLDFSPLKEELNSLRNELQQQGRKNTEDFQLSRKELNDTLQAQRLEISQQIAAQSEQLRKSFADFMQFLMEFRDAARKNEEQSSAALTQALQQHGDRNDRKFGELVHALDEKIMQLKNSVQEENRNARKEQQDFQTKFQQGISVQFEQNRTMIDTRLKNIQEDNSKRLDEMKKTVDEKLQESVDKHFNESFKLISERLEQVHKGLGEMQNLAAGVGDLKKVLTNVKTRGNLGEIQLTAILEQYLAPDQYVANVSTVPNSRELVEFAVKMPGKLNEKPVLLPIDSKFPVEDYSRLLESYEQFPRMSPELKKAQELFARTVKKCAQDIHDKYLYPPLTTAFGMMFVPSEGIYAEILRIPGLFEQIQQEFKIAVVGPSNLVAFLNALQLGFKTLAIEKRSNEVWNILGAVKTEFRKFGEEMDSTRKSLQSVVNHVEKIGTRSRALERQLRDVHELPAEEAQKLLEGTEE